MNGDTKKFLKKNPEIEKFINEMEASKSSDAGKNNDPKSPFSGPASLDPRTFSVLQEVKKHPLYRISNRDKKARQIIKEHEEKQKNKITSKNNITPGQLVMFKYLHPKTEEELEYYDAAPCTIFFGMFNAPEGKRVLGFNIHYFPPKIRYVIMDRIYQMYKPIYRKYFETGVPKEMDGFDYRYITEELERQNLSFAVRMYDPKLIGGTYIVPPNMWVPAIFTEGWFRKETRAKIMNFFKKDAAAKHKVHSIKDRKKKKKSSNK